MNRFLSLVKFLFTCGLFLVLVGFVIIREKDITTIVRNYVFPNQNKVDLGEVNAYYRDYDFSFVQNTQNFSPHNYQDILNIYYTVINAGKTNFTFYCPSEYEDCLEDIQDLANNQDLLSDINNFVHPFNGFAHIETEYDTLGRVTINIMKAYTDEEIALVNQRVDELVPQLVSPTRSNKDNVLAIHDYIINHTKYDSTRSDQNISLYKSDIAYGPLFQGYALCGGYTDLMELFLERMNIKSFKVSSDSHIWNAVLLDNVWYHIDLTWDDPVSSDGKDYLEHNYFLVTTPVLWSMERSQHAFNTKVLQELQ